MRIACLLVLAASAAAAAPYPVKLATLDPAALGKRDAEFRTRNPQHWLYVSFDDFGGLLHAATDDPVLAGADLAGVRDLARRNADFFGIAPADADRIATTIDGDVLVDRTDGVTLGELVVRHATISAKAALTIDARRFVGLAPKVKLDAVVRRLVGRTYAIAATFTQGLPPDCGQTPRGFRACAPPKTLTINRETRLTVADLAVSTALHRDGDTLRLVRCAELVVPAPPDFPHRVGDATATPKRAAPILPLVVDAVTGETLATGVASCIALGNFR